MDKQCRKQQDNMSAYLDGELDEAERQALERHTAVCDRCARELRSLRAAVSLVQGLPHAAAPEALSASVGREIRAPKEGRESRSGWTRRLWPAAAAAAIAMLVYFASPRDQDFADHREDGPADRDATAYGVLSDGEESRLDPRSHALKSPVLASVEARVFAKDAETTAARVANMARQLDLHPSEAVSPATGSAFEGPGRAVRALVSRVERAGYRLALRPSLEDVPAEGWIRIVFVFEPAE